MAWDSAAGHQDERCGYSDWHLPALTELEGLLNEGSIPAIDLSVFPNTPPGSFWTATPSTRTVGHVWYVNFGRGAVEHVFKDVSFHIRLVRELEPKAASPTSGPVCPESAASLACR
jgi:hypothetical protein